MKTKLLISACVLSLVTYAGSNIYACSGSYPEAELSVQRYVCIDSEVLLDACLSEDPDYCPYYGCTGCPLKTCLVCGNTFVRRGIRDYQFWPGDGEYYPVSALAGSHCWHTYDTVGDYTAKVRVWDHDSCYDLGSDKYDECTQPVTVVKVDKIQYKIGNDAYQDCPNPLVVAKDANVTFKAIKNPSSAQWPPARPAWSGSSGAYGFGEEIELVFVTASSSPTDYKTVQAECGNTVTVNVVVVYLAALEINGNRTSEPSESSFLVRPGDHIEIGGTFKYDLMLNEWPTPVKLGAEIWDLDYEHEVIASGTGKSISHTFGTGGHDDGTCKVRFYFDDDTTGDSDYGDPKVDSPNFEAQALTYHYLTFGKSSAVSGTPGTGDACRDATDLILRKDTDGDYRATAKFIAAGLSTIPHNGHDPVRVRTNSSGLFVRDYFDFHGDWEYFYDYDSSEIIIVDELSQYDHNNNYIGALNALSFKNIKYEIFMVSSEVDGDTLAHEVGHSCGLDDLTDPSEVDRVMYKYGSVGNDNILTQSEAADFE